MGFPASTVEEAVVAANKIGYPVILRAAFALGGLGSGFCHDDKSTRELAQRAFSSSPQVLVERSMKGWKEIEYEVVRDSQDNCITVRRQPLCRALTCSGCCYLGRSGSCYLTCSGCCPLEGV